MKNHFRGGGMLRRRNRKVEKQLDKVKAVAQRGDVRKDAGRLLNDFRSLVEDVSKARRRRSRMRAFAGAAAVAGLAGGAAWLWRGRQDEAAVGLSGSSRPEYAAH
jgi:hypothetical protein